MLQVLFAADSTDKDPVATLTFFRDHFSGDEEQVVKTYRVVDEYAQRLVAAVARDREVIDKIISKLSHHWKLYRINRVDKNILRMAIAEMTTFPEIPVAVVLDEAIEMGRNTGPRILLPS